MKEAFPPRSAISFATRLPLMASMSAMVTKAPSFARRLAVDSPIPEAAPVTMATLPATRPFIVVVMTVLLY